MAGVDDLAGTVVQAQAGGGVSLRVGVVAAVNAGPPKSLDVTVDGTTVAGCRYSATYYTIGPAPGDVVVVLVTRPGGSGRRGGRERGGAAFVVDRIAV